jgi:hypothetical protein
MLGCIDFFCNDVYGYGKWLGNGLITRNWKKPHIRY